MSNQREHKSGYGAFFANDKGGNASRADYTGEINIEGKIYRLAGWKKKSGKGTTYLSLAAEPKRATSSANNDPF